MFVAVSIKVFFVSLSCRLKQIKSSFAMATRLVVEKKSKDKEELARIAFGVD